MTLNMNKLRLLALATAAVSASAFAPPAPKTTSLTSIESTTVPYFIDLVEPEAPPMETASVAAAKPQKKNAPMKAKKPASTTHQEGIFSPVVKAAKIVLGEKTLNKVRAKGISLHSQVIGDFVATADTPFGKAALRRLFTLSDKDGNGTIDKEELREALTVLGFKWIKDKQVEGIFTRADTDGNGAIDYEEWCAEAPRTLRTNLIKLAKTNGGELGFLV